GPYGMQQHARDVAMAMQRLGLGPSIVVGYSMGATADSQGLQPNAAVKLHQPLEQRAHDPRARHPERMAQSNTSARPLDLSLNGSTPMPRADGRTCAANAALISTLSTSSIVMPAQTLNCRPAPW